MEQHKWVLGTLAGIVVGAVAMYAVLQPQPMPVQGDAVLGAVIRGADKSIGVKVTEDGSLRVRAVIESEFEAESEEGNAFSWSSEFIATAGEEIIYLQNTDTSKNLHLEHVILSSTETTTFELFEVTSGTAAGTTITPINLNLTSGNFSNDNSFGDAAVTGSLSGTIITRIVSPLNESIMLDVAGIILGNNDDIAITVNKTASTTVTIFGHYATTE